MTETNIQQKIPFLVRVSCFTFNHAPFIEDAMNGFTMQQTEFPFVCTIVDDASTDGEPEVIKKYLQEHFNLEDQTIVRNEETDDYVMTFARHKTKHNCYFAVYFLKYNHYSIKKDKMPYIMEWYNTKYIAICEGDDYWIDEKKLMNQVDFLEKNVDVGMVYSSYLYLDEKTKTIRKTRFDNKNNPPSLENILLNKCQIGTLTVLYRRDVLQKIVSIPSETWFKMGDLPLWIKIAYVSKISYLEEDVAHYRILEQSASHSTSFTTRMQFLQNAWEIRLYYANLFGQKSLIDQIRTMIDKIEWKIMIYNLNFKEMSRKSYTSLSMKDIVEIAVAWLKNHK